MESDSRGVASSIFSDRTKPGDKVVLVKGIAGLGNRILCAVGAILYARLSGRRLVIDWTDALYSSNGDNVLHRFFNSRACFSDDELPTTESIFPEVWRNRLHQEARQLVVETQYNPDEVRCKLSLDQAKLDYQEDIVVVVEYDAAMERLRGNFHGPLQALAQMSSSDILARLLREEFVLRAEIRERIDRFKRERFDARTVGVHVRFSDYRVRLFAIIKQLNALLAREPGLQIFLATDNIEVKKMFERTYPRVLTTAHWYSRPGRPIHKTSDSSSRTERAIEGLMDIYLLAECDYLIGDASSTFWELASLLSSAPAQNKVDVAATGDHNKGHRRYRSTMTRVLRRVRFSSWAFRLLPRLVPLRRL